MLNSKKNWYIIQVLSGFESKVVELLKKHIKLYQMENSFDKIIVPSEKVIEIKGGKKKKSDRKFFPGYILIKMNMNESTWHFIKKIPKVTGFVGGRSDKPAKISNEEVKKIVNKFKRTSDKPKPKTLFEPGEMIRVSDGPFIDFNGVVEEVDYEKNKFKVSVSIFGRATPVELDFSQVEKL